MLNAQRSDERIRDMARGERRRKSQSWETQRMS